MSSIIIEIQEICTENQFIIEEIIPSIINENVIDSSLLIPAIKKIL